MSKSPTKDPWAGIDGSRGAAAREGSTPDLPSEAARYRGPQQVGQGAIGRVDAVFDEVLGRQVARKTLLDPAQHQGLIREAQLTARLDHPGIVTVHDMGRNPDGTLWYTMALVRGRSLAACLEQDAPSPLRWAPKLLSVCWTMAYAHDAGVLHRDLKPDNIMIGPDSEVIVVDWGLATTLEEQAAGERTEAVGTPEYMAPEQKAGSALTAQADIFAIGRCLLRVCERSSGPETPALRAIGLRASHPVPAERYPSMRALAEEIARWQQGQRVQAHAYTAQELLRMRLRPHRRSLMVAATLLGVGLLGIAAALLWGWTEWQRAEQAQESSRALALESLAQSGERALRDGDPGAAQSALTQAQALGMSPRLRGIQMALGTHGRVRLASQPISCDWSELHPDGRLLCSKDGTLQHRDASGTLLDVWPQHVDSATWDAEGAVVALSQTRLMRIEEHAELRFSPQTPKGELEMGPEGVEFAMLDTRNLWFLEGQHAHRLTCPDFSPLLGLGVRGARWAAACEEKGLLLGSGLETPHLLPLEGLRSSDVALLPDGGFLVGTLDGQVARLAEDGAVLWQRSLAESGAVQQIRLSEDGALAALQTQFGPIRVLRTSDLACLSTVDGRAAAFVDGGLRVVGDQTTLWRLPEQPRYVTASEGIATVGFDRAGRPLYGAGDGSVGIWQAGGVRVHQLEASVIKRVQDGPGGLRVATAVDGFWDLARERPVHWIEGGFRDAGPVQDDGSQLLLGYQATIRYQPGSEEALSWRADHISSSADGQRHVLTGGGAFLRVLDASGLRVLMQQGSGLGSISASGQTLAATQGATLYLWQGEEPLAPIPIPFGPTALAVGEHHVYLGYTNGELLVVAHGSGEILARAHVHRGRISSLALQDEVLLSGSWDRTLRTWDLSPLQSSK